MKGIEIPVKGIDIIEKEIAIFVAAIEMPRRERPIFVRVWRTLGKMRGLRLLGVATIVTPIVVVAGCFGSSSGGPRDAGPDLDEPAFDAPSFEAGHDGTVGDGGGHGDGGAGDAGGDGAVVCTKSTCTGVEVKFIGWATGNDGGVANCEIAVDDGTPDGGPNGTVVPALSPTDPGIAGRNALVGNFVATDAGVVMPLEYTVDNNACNVPDFPDRQNAYYLVSMQGLPIGPSWGQPCGCGGNCGGACDSDGGPYLCDFEQGFYSQSCPNFGFNCVSTPERIEEIDVIATSADTTCKVCVYDSTDPSQATAIKCVSPGASLQKAAFVGADGGATYPALVRLDDGTGCASY